MNPSPITILYAFLGGLLLTGVVAWIKRSRLALLVPKLFIYSNVSKSGQLAELTIFNRGFRTEEAVEISLNPRLKYELVGKTAENISLSNTKIEVSKIGASTDVTLILLVENGEFGKTDIISCVSKETTGKLYDSLEFIPATGNQRIAGLLVFLVIPSVMLLIFLKYSDAAREFLGNNLDTKDKVLDGGPKLEWDVPQTYKDIFSGLYKDFEGGKIRIRIEPPSLKGKIASVPFIIFNDADYPIEVTMDMVTAHSGDLLERYEGRVPSILVFPGKNIKRSAKIAILPNSKDVSDRTAFIEVFVQQNGASSDTLMLKKVHIFDATP